MLGSYGSNPRYASASWEVVAREYAGKSDSERLPNLDDYGSLGVKKVDAAIRFDKIRRITPYTFIGPSGQLKWLNG